MIRMRGTGGEIRTGCRVAARLKRWAIENDVLQAEGAEVDDFWADDPGPKSVRLRIGESEWTWRDVNVMTWRPTLVATVPGSPERR
jgi:hypothetical protein